MSLDYITHPDCALHVMDSLHPESPARIASIHTQLQKSGLLDRLTQHTAAHATKQQLLRVHAADYIKFIHATSPQTGIAWLDADTSMNPHTLDAALFAAGSGVMAVDLIMRNETNRVFCNVRPPGHHAEYDRAMGFCFFNNIAVAAAHALTHYGLQRVAIVDFDVHHGNGTEDIFLNDERVLYCSSFQHPYYPYTDINSVNDHIIKSPLESASDGRVFRSAVMEQWLPAIRKHQPQMIFVSAGFDAHIDDSLAGLAWQDQDYAWITDTIRQQADRYAQGRIVSMLEGGYALSALQRCVQLHIEALLVN